MKRQKPGLSRRDWAYQYMIELIQSGVEFPIAHERAVLKYDLPDLYSRYLIDRYDKEQTN